MAKIGETLTVPTIMRSHSDYIQMTDTKKLQIINLQKQKKS